MEPAQRCGVYAREQPQRIDVSDQAVEKINSKSGRLTLVEEGGAPQVTFGGWSDLDVEHIAPRHNQRRCSTTARILILASSHGLC